MDPERVSREDPVCHTQFCLFVAQFLPGRIITLRAELVLGSKVSSTRHITLGVLPLACSRPWRARAPGVLAPRAYPVPPSSEHQDWMNFDFTLCVLCLFVC